MQKRASSPSSLIVPLRSHPSTIDQTTEVTHLSLRYSSSYHPPTSSYPSLIITFDIPSLLAHANTLVYTFIPSHTATSRLIVLLFSSCISFTRSHLNHSFFLSRIQYYDPFSFFFLCKKDMTLSTYFTRAKRCLNCDAMREILFYYHKTPAKPDDTHITPYKVNSWSDLMDRQGAELTSKGRVLCRKPGWGRIDKR